ncbi:MAG: CocE/NonD family hydrolase [Betaproteobacteria bacterium]|nr:CocE/NonD family hydrolase [Betaproteobacteria bacterium]
MSDRDHDSAAWRVPPGAYLAGRPAPHTLPARPFSVYLGMRDGVRIAVDVYLPQGGGAPHRFPTVVIATPYYRRFRTSDPAAENSPMAFRYRDAFVPRGYALLVMDVRGTGASFGHRDSFRSPKERDDYGEIVQWIVDQPWSDGRVGATGISYPGAAAVFLASTGHPAVKAVAPLFAINDIYTDQLYPGGMLSRVWVEDYNDCIVALDHDRTEALRQYAYFSDRRLLGPEPVDDDPQGHVLQRAMREHRQSFNLRDAAGEYFYRGEGLAHNPSLTLDICSPGHYLERIRPEVALLSVSGWYDGSGYSNATISRFLTVNRDRHHLLLGPWDHGARTNGSPWRDAQAPEFNLFAEVIRFFDHYLMGLATGLDRESPVHYFSVHHEAWAEAASWPPLPRCTTLHLSADGLTERPDAQPAIRVLQVDFTHTSGRQTRWERLGLRDVTVLYGDWPQRELGLLCFDTPPFACAMELSGHAIARLVLTSSEADAAVFVYLAEVEVDGASRYVTEGFLRALHRQTASRPAHYRGDWTFHPCTRAAAQPLVPGQSATLEIALLPVSWRFAAGSRLRVAIAGADALHFPPVPHGRPPRLEFACGGEGGSRLELPLRASSD